jgi:hypothetical protein
MFQQDRVKGPSVKRLGDLNAKTQSTGNKSGVNIDLTEQSKKSSDDDFESY